MGIEIGDFISFDPRTVVTETGLSSLATWMTRLAQQLMLNLRVYKEESELPVTTHLPFSL